MMENEKLTTRDKLLFTCAIVTLIAALGFGVAGFIVSPVGEVHDSVLWLIAQLLLFTASAFGLGAYTTATTRAVRKEMRRFASKHKTSNEDPEEEPDAEE